MLEAAEVVPAETSECYSYIELFKLATEFETDTALHY